MYVFSFWGFASQTHTGSLHLDPTGGLAFPRFLSCPTLKQIPGYAPASSVFNLGSATAPYRL